MRSSAFQFTNVLQVVACLAALLGHRVVLADIEPYAAKVTVPRALVYSGPGEKFYPTSSLNPGETVEVYREEKGGWLGIRPLQGSFSLVPEKAIEEQDNGLARVREDSTASRIGSELSDKSNATQVRLKRGEVVEVLGRQPVNGETWVRIAPPAGEFRWIHAASVQRQGAIGEAETVPAEPKALSEDMVANEGTISGDSVSSSSDDEWRASVTPVAGEQVAEPAATQELAAPPLATSTTASPADPTVPATSAAPTAVPLPPAVPVDSAVRVGPPPVATGDFQRQLTDIEMRLSRMASAPPQQWNTERLQRDTEQLLAQAQTQPERDAAKATLIKIDQFTALARRYQQGAQAAVPGQPGVTSLPVPPANAGFMNFAGMPGAGTSQLPGAAPYDAVGVLRPVVSKRPGAPQFALVDDRGQVITFVTPSPDVNLQPYLGRRVGVAGNRGFIPEFNRAHLTAGRVTPLVR